MTDEEEEENNTTDNDMVGDVMNQFALGAGQEPSDEVDLNNLAHLIANEMLQKHMSAGGQP